ncbi:hypothetical protein [Kutzneria sp. NPDC051319]|uniref:hypothetical protein n=1 Tax=Kutzneria sp. NPDC051319 TaxID=3155047 RepID=UPI00341E1D4D
MTDETCPRCSWPVAELPPQARHPGRQGVEYLRCLCGSWLARVDGVVVGATRAS